MVKYQSWIRLIDRSTRWGWTKTSRVASSFDARCKFCGIRSEEDYRHSASRGCKLKVMPVFCGSSRCPLLSFKPSVRTSGATLSPNSLFYLRLGTFRIYWRDSCSRDLDWLARIWGWSYCYFSWSLWSFFPLFELVTLVESSFYEKCYSWSFGKYHNNFERPYLFWIQGFPPLLSLQTFQDWILLFSSRHSSQDW